MQERQQFHLEQLRAVEFRQRQMAAQQLINESKLTIPQINLPPQQVVQMQPAVMVASPVVGVATAPNAVQQQQQQQAVGAHQQQAPIVMMTANAPMPAAQVVASPLPSIVSVQQPQMQSAVAQQPSPQAQSTQQPQQAGSRPPSTQPPTPQAQQAPATPQPSENTTTPTNTTVTTGKLKLN